MRRVPEKKRLEGLDDRDSCPRLKAPEERPRDQSEEDGEQHSQVTHPQEVVIGGLLAMPSISHPDGKLRDLGLTRLIVGEQVLGAEDPVAQ